jgi:Fe-S oxidoreductase
MRDLEIYYNKVVDGGIVAGHDYLNMAYGVNKAVNQFCEEMGIEVNLIPDEDESMSGFWFIKQ